MNRNRNAGRSGIMGVAGGYLLYLAYQLLKNLIDNVPTTMPRWVAILSITVFTGIGVTLVIYALKLWKKGREDQDEQPVELEEKEPEAEPGQDDQGK